ncbi:hypothetical protein [Candidatus Lokiarchaeum ossiferum]|uniref:hypothetical protein n=1 Tax=Candidatus Lokiarchaeum ossiferum TaxID=2951803 RepID=UPI00352F4414
MENERVMQHTVSNEQRSSLSSNLIFASVELENFAELKKNKRLLIPIILGLFFELIIDLILIPIFETNPTFEVNPLLFLTLMKMISLRILIPVWFLKMLQNVINYRKMSSFENNKPAQSASPLRSLKESLIHVPSILMINLIISIFEIGKTFISYFSQEIYVNTASSFLSTILLIVAFLINVAFLIFELFLSVVFIHWMILSVYNEDRLEQSFKDSWKYVQSNFKHIINQGMIPVLVTLVVSIILAINPLFWLNVIIVDLWYYFVIFFVVLVFGGNYLKNQ